MAYSDIICVYKINTQHFKCINQVIIKPRVKTYSKNLSGYVDDFSLYALCLKLDKRELIYTFETVCFRFYIHKRWQKSEYTILIILNVVIKISTFYLKQ